MRHTDLPAQMKAETNACSTELCQSALARELEMLPACSRLIESERIWVLLARAHEIPLALRELGRLRERAFRAIGEGTGGELDLDRFDASYSHLVAWDRRKGALAGAYRLAATWDFAPRELPQALYTHTLFDYGTEFLARLGPAIELGRAFVRPEYQRCSRVLALLWQAIGKLWRALPETPRLFGAVSVSASFTPDSRALIAASLLQHHPHSPSHGLVRARNPLPLCARDFAAGRTLSAARALSARVAELEPDGRGLPVLLRRYLELGGEFAAFHVDREFGHSLDGLLVLDLERADRARVARFGGPADEAAAPAA
jgi:putative hemolysin